LQFSEDQLAVKFRGQFGIINKEEQWLLSPQPHPVLLAKENYYFEKRDPNTFLKTFAGDVIYFTSNPVSVEDDHVKEILPDGTEKRISFQGLEIGRSAAPVSSDGIEAVFAVSEGMRGIKKDGKFGFVDGLGRLRIANRYDGVGSFHEGLAPVKLIGKWGYVNSSDEIVINPNYDAAGPFVNQVALVWRNGKAGLIDPEGKTLLAFRYDSIRRLPDKTFLIQGSGLHGLADQKGNVLVEPRFDFLDNLLNGYLIAGREGRFGLLTRDGLSTVPMIYDCLVYDPERNQYLALKKSPWKEIKLE
jgi:hypothetical protein